MKKISLISRKESSPVVTNLHEALITLGFNNINAVELQTHTAGNTTQRAVRALQKEYDISYDRAWIVDQMTADKMNALLEEQGLLEENVYLIHGTITYQNRPVSGINVQAFDQDLPSKRKPLELLGGAVITDGKGHYRIAYSPGDFSATEKRSADVTVVVSNADRGEIHRTPVLFNAGPDEMINIELSEIPGRDSVSEFDNYVQLITPLLGNVLISKLSSEDIIFLQNETEIVQLHLTKLNTSHVWSEESRGRIAPEIFYGLLRQGFSLRIEDWINKSFDEYREAIERAVEVNIVATSVLEELDSQLELLMEFVIAQTRNSKRDEDQASVQELLSTLLPDKDLQEHFLRSYREGSDDRNLFWESLKNDPELGDRVPAIQFAFQLSKLSANNFSLIQAIQDLEEVKSLENLIAWDESAWRNLIEEKEVPVPKYISGKDDSEKIGNYSLSLKTIVEKQFPTQAVAYNVSRQRDFDTELLNRAWLLLDGDEALSALEIDTLKFPEWEKPEAEEAKRHLNDLQREVKAFPEFEPILKEQINTGVDIHNPIRGEINTFLGRLDDFSFDRTPVDLYFETLADETWDGIEYPDQVRAQLRRMQRLYNIGGDVHLMFTLLELGMHSANQIGNMPLEHYVQITSEDIGVPKALATHAKASQISDSVVVIYQSIYEYSKQVKPAAIGFGKGDAAEIIKDIPKYEKLFGAFDLCECSHCRSVYSATAYFVDLLHQVLGGKYFDNYGSLATPIKELFKRRPDLQFLKLTCENTNTLIPYIDLVNEILETYVAFGALSETHTRDTSEFTAKELASNPQFFVKEAYDKLRNEIYPISLPFDLSLEAARSYLEHSGSSLFEVMRIFNTKDDLASQNALIVERLKISPKEYEILTGVSLDGNNSVLNINIKTLFGYTGNTNAIQKLEKVPELLAKLEIDYETLVSLLKTSFINPTFQVAQFLQDPDVLQTAKDTFKQQNPALAAKAEQETIVLVSPNDAQCDLTKTTLLHADQTSLKDSEFLRIYRFIRLWRTLNLPVREVDLLITKLSKNSIPTINIELLNKIGQTVDINNGLKMPYEALLTFWSPINTLGEKSLYEKLFLNKTALKIDDGFLLNPQREELQLTNLPINDHIPALLAALRISESDLRTILNYMQLDPASTMLELAVISPIYRYASLSKARRIKIEDLIGLLRLLDFDIFSSVEATLDFIHIHQRISDSDFTLKDLRYLYKHDRDLPDSAIGTEMMAMAKEIMENLNKIEAENLDIDHPNSEEVGNKLGKIFEEDILQQAMGTINSSFLYSTALASLPFPSFPESFQGKFSFRITEQELSCKGLMTPAEQVALKGLSNDTDYLVAVDDLFEQPRTFFEETFYGFLNASDVDILFNEQPTSDGNILDNVHGRNAYFLMKLLPFLRSRLRNEWVQQSIAAYFKLDADVADALLQNVLHSTKDPNLMIVQDILNLQTTGWDATYYDDLTLTSQKLARLDARIDFDWGLDSPDTTIPADNFSARWLGKLSVTNTEEYTFFLYSDDGVRLWIDDEILIDSWIDQPLTAHKVSINLKAGEIYTLKLEHYEKSLEATIQLKWSSPTMAKQVVPAEQVVPASIVDTFMDSFIRLQKVSSFINKFDLDHRELVYFSNNKQHFEDFDLNGMPVAAPANYDPKLFLQWLRMFNYTALRKELPRSEENNLISVFNSASTDFKGVENALLASAGWTEDSLLALIGEDFGQGMWTPAADDFKNEIFLTRLQNCIDLSTRIGIAEEKLNSWKALSMSEAIEEDIKNTIRAKYDEETWPDISKTIHDVLRVKQRKALTSYLLAQPNLPQNIFTTNDLYQYFLIDVEMEACMMTSRLVQANASIQLFVQRCLMNLEVNVSPDMINADHWKWMKKYRVWEANRKVFLYPENWIEPELRDDKSPFFKELENELLQGEINDQNVEKATINYLQQLETVAQLDIRSVHHAGGETHVFGRTFNTPHNYYYRKYKKTKVWTPWAKVQTDIEGNYMTSVVWNNRLYIFWPIFLEKAKRDATKLLSAEEPEKELEVKLAWSEFRQGNWTPKQISTGFFMTEPTHRPYMLYTRILTNNTLEVYLADFNSIINDYLESWEDSIDVLGYWWRDLGKFSFAGCNRPAEVTSINMGQNNAHMTNFTDGYEELYSGGNLGYVTENGNKNILTNNNLFGASVRTEENFPRFRQGKTFFLQDKYKSYWVTSKPRKRITITESAPLGPGNLDIGEIELPVWIDDNPLDLWWEHPVQDISPDFKLEWDSPIILESYRNDVFSPTQHRAALHGESAMSVARLGNDLDEPEHLMYMRQFQNSGDMAFRYPSLGISDKYYSYLKSEKSLTFHNFYHHYVCTFVKALNKDGVKGLFDIKNQKYTDNNKKFSDLGPSFYYVDTPYPKEHIDFDLQGAYSQYNWELFFHLPMLIANRLYQDQRFEEAQKWYHYVFNPTSSANESSPKRFWNVLPFKTTPQETLKELMDTLNLPDGNKKKAKLIDQIEQWRDDPFKPHLIARLRPIAYMKNAFMKYLDNLIAWGDYLFRQDSLESINEATQLYILAAELLGEKPEKVPARGKVTPETYSSLRPKLNEFSNAMVDLETYFPFYSEASFPPSNGSPAGPLKTTAQTLYFCLPDNDNLLKYWDTVADRLFKIRHCQNIEGIERQLALFEPPIDPALLVKAVAGGLDIGSVLNDLNSPLPSYRFTYILQKALEMTGELKSFGAQLLSALEKKDAERLSAIRAAQDTEMLKLLKEIKKMQITEARTTYESLLNSREIAVQKYKHYQSLLGEGLVIPQMGASIQDVALPADKGSGEGDKKLLSFEKHDLAKSEEAAGDQRTASMWETLANVSYYIPEVQAEPWGIGVSFGGSHVGPALSAISAEYQRLSTKNGFYAAKASKLGGYFRREQDWVLETNLAAKEIMQIDKQITAAEIRVQIADKELQTHEQQIVDAEKIEEFLRNKYTNEELYGWMQGQISSLFFQSYKLAYDLAKKAEKTYRFEHGITSSNFIEFGYWNSFRKGLLSGEKLYLSLKRLEKDYLEKNKRDYEITKNISVSLINPLALLKLKETGECELDIPELLFDLDHPGHYFRRIKSVSITIPCIVGPYASVSAKLTLLKNRIRKNGNSQAEYAYTGIDDPNFTHNLVGMQSIATSSAQGDSGMFELNFRDERYLPFEGAGAISTWKLELPDEFRAFNYETISDVILHMNYTAREGGDALKGTVNSHVSTTLNNWMDELAEEETGLVRLISIKQEFSTEWHRFLQPQEDEVQQLNLHRLAFEIKQQHFPYFLRDRALSLMDVSLVLKLKNNEDNDLAVGLAVALLEGKNAAATEVTPATNSGLQKGIANLPMLAFNTIEDPLGWWGIQVNNADVHTDLKIENNDNSPAALDDQKIEDMYLVLKYTVGA